MSPQRRFYYIFPVIHLQVIDLEEYRQPGQPITHHFGIINHLESLSFLGKRRNDPAASNLDRDGLPFVGTKLKSGDPLYS
jgi:hypothetical protein